MMNVDKARLYEAAERSRQGYALHLYAIASRIPWTTAADCAFKVKVKGLGWCLSAQVCSGSWKGVFGALKVGTPSMLGRIAG